MIARSLNSGAIRWLAILKAPAPVKNSCDNYPATGGIYQKKAANEAAQRQKIAVVYYCVIRLQQTHHW